MMGEAAWNFDNGDYAREVLDGDIHTKNANGFSLATGKTVGRKESKSPFYAGIYGCQDKKMAQLLCVDPSVGGKILQALWDAAPGLKKCKDALEKYWERTGKKYILAINGMKIFTRSKHSLLNAYLQSSDSILMDWACCWIDREITLRNIDANRWVYSHDEVNYYSRLRDITEFYFSIDNKPKEFRDGIQYSKPKIFRGGKVINFEVKEKDILPTDQWIQWYSEVGEICVQGMRNAGKFFNFRVPIDGQYIVGGSWADTH